MLAHFHNLLIVCAVQALIQCLRQSMVICEAVLAWTVVVLQVHGAAVTGGFAKVLGTTLSPYPPVYARVDCEESISPVPPIIGAHTYTDNRQPKVGRHAATGGSGIPPLALNLLN